MPSGILQTVNKRMLRRATLNSYYLRVYDDMVVINLKE